MARIVDKETSGIYKAQDGESEMIANRTRSFKKFKKGRKRRIAGQIGPIHYRTDPFSDTEQYKEIDLTISLTPGELWDAAMESNGYQVRFWQSRVIAGKTVRYIAQFRRAGKWLALAPLALVWENDAGDRQLISKPAAGIVPVIDNDSYTVTWADCFGSGIHYRYNVRPDHFFKTVIVDNKTDLPVPTISGTGLKLTVVMGISWHSQSKAANGFAGSIVPDEIPNDTDVSGIDEELHSPDRFAYQDQFLRDTFCLQKPNAWDSAEEHHMIDVEWRMQRKGNHIFALLSVPASALNHIDMIYPVFIDIDISEEQVPNSAYDAFRRYADSTFYNGTGSLFVGSFNATNYRYVTGVVFTTVPISQGVTINSASLKFTPRFSDSGATCRTKLQGEDADDAGIFSNEGNFTARFGNLTTASVTWEPLAWTAEVEVTSPDIASLVQEITDRGLWVSGNGLGLFFHDNDDLSDTAAFRRPHGAGTGTAAKFNASYTIPARGQVMFIQR